MPDPLTIIKAAVDAANGSNDAWNYISDLKNAPEHILAVAATLRICRSTLDKLERFHRKHAAKADADGYGEFEAVEGITSDFQKTCSQLAEFLKPYKGTHRFLKRILVSVRWRFNSKRVLHFHSELRRQQELLNLVLIEHIHAATHFTGVDTRRMLKILRKWERAKSVSDDEENELASEFDKLDDRTRDFVGYRGSYASNSDLRSVPSSVGRSWSPNPDVALAGSGSIAAVLSLPSGVETNGNRAATAANNTATVANVQATRTPTHQRSGDALRGTGIKVEAATASITANGSGVPASYAERASHQVDTSSRTAAQSHSRAELQSAQVSHAPPPRYHVVRDPEGRYGAFPANRIGSVFVDQTTGTPDTLPGVQEMRSAPSLVNSTFGMTESETRAWVQGHLSGLDTNVERQVRRLIRSAGSLVDRPYAHPEPARQRNPDSRQYDSANPPIAQVSPQDVQQHGDRSRAHGQHLRQARNANNWNAKDFNREPSRASSQQDDHLRRPARRTSYARDSHESAAGAPGSMGDAVSGTVADGPSSSAGHIHGERRRPSRHTLKVHRSVTAENTGHDKPIQQPHQAAPATVNPGSRPRVPLESKPRNPSVRPRETQSTDIPEYLKDFLGSRGQSTLAALQQSTGLR